MAIHQMLLGGAGIILVLANSANVNLYQQAGSPTNPVSVNVTVPASVTIGSASSAVYSLTIGAFPAGSRVRIDNFGRIYGAGGAPNGGNGGGCINASFAGVTVEIVNQSGGEIKAGGGGGGRGGSGGAGGVGGQGYFQAWGAEEYQQNKPTTYWITIVGRQTDVYVYDHGTMHAYYGAYQSTELGTYRRGTLRLVQEDWEQDHQSLVNIVSFYAIQRLQDAYTPGGPGGAPSGGGNGGRGRGFDGAPTTGVTGGGRTAGAAGGTNAGTGGYGGGGGIGGAGAEWGLSGAAGAPGEQGGIGSSGNYTGGQVGSPGNPGQAGGPPGYYLFKGTANVTFTNYGTVAGLLG